VHVASAGASLTLVEARQAARDLDRVIVRGTSRLVLDLSATRFAARPALVVVLREARAVMRSRRGQVVVVAPAERHETLGDLLRDEELLAPEAGRPAALDRSREDAVLA
jgi:hypothetical protein